MRKTLTAMLLAGATALTPAAGAAERLTFGTGNVVIHPINQLLFTPWSDKVNAEGGDALELAVRHGQMLVSSTNFVDRVTDDVVQIAWGMLVFDPGRFPRSLVATIPFIEGSAEATAMAFCQLYESGALDEEMAEYKPLFFVPFPQSSVHLNGTPVSDMTALDGQKIMVGSPMASAVVSAYGGTPLSISLPEHYQSLQRGTADGNFMTFTAFPAFNLHEVTTDHMKVPLGGAAGMVFMTRERYDALSDEARAVLDANSGCDVSREMGARVDLWEADGEAFVAAAGHSITEIDPAELTELQADLGPVVEASFTDRVPGGDEVLAAWKAAMDAANAELCN